MASLTVTLIVVAAVVVVVGVIFLLLSHPLAAFYDRWWQLPGVVGRIGWSLLRSLGGFLARGGKPRFPEWTFAYDVGMALLHDLSDHYGDCITTRENAPIMRRQTEQLGDFLGRSAHKANHTRLEPFEFNGLEHLWVKSAATEAETPRYRVVVMYIHGGGYVTLSPRLYQSLASELQPRVHRILSETLGVEVSEVQVDVLLANYRKAPEYRYPRAPLDVLAVYKYLLEQEKLSPHQILVMGDSAGGGLTMTTMLRLRDEDPALLPVAGILSCPFVDRETKGDQTKTPHCVLTDRLIDAFGHAYYTLEGPPSNWGDASPYHCDLHGLPPVYIQTGDLDYLLAHSLRLHQKARDSGLASWTLEIFPNMPHVFTLAPPFVLPTATAGVEAMAHYAATQFATALKPTRGSETKAAVA